MRWLPTSLTLLGVSLCWIAPDARAGIAVCTPEISVIEEIADEPGGGILGQYVMTTGDLCGLQIVALAVDNDDSVGAYANLSGWSGTVVTDDFWDAGIVVSRDDLGSGDSYSFTTGPEGIGSFASFFGPIAQLANLYNLSAHYGGPVVDDSTAFTAVGDPISLPDDAFQFETQNLASTPIAFLFDPRTGATVAMNVVPEPGTLSLLGLGLLGLRSVRRR
jgi:hypothetical protein